MIEKWVDDWTKILATDLINGNLGRAEIALGHLVACSTDTEELRDAMDSARHWLPQLFYKPRVEIYEQLKALKSAALSAGPNSVARAMLIH
jgi:hypothetical protein